MFCLGERVQFRLISGFLAFNHGMMLGIIRVRPLKPLAL